MGKHHTVSNLFAGIPENLPEELSQEIISGADVKIERIVSRGHRSPDGFWYDQQWDEWVLLIKGRAGLEFEGDPAAVDLKPGDHLLIPAHQRHRVAWTADAEETIWLAMHIRCREKGEFYCTSI
jgi:cupin 2 domain-containing protein